ERASKKGATTTTQFTSERWYYTRPGRVPGRRRAPPSARRLEWPRVQLVPRSRNLPGREDAAGRRARAALARVQAGALPARRLPRAAAVRRSSLSDRRGPDRERDAGRLEPHQQGGRLTLPDAVAR